MYPRYPHHRHRHLLPLLLRLVLHLWPLWSDPLLRCLLRPLLVLVRCVLRALVLRRGRREAEHDQANEATNTPCRRSC